VMAETDASLTAELPSSDGNTPVDMTLSWDLPMEKGDIYYSMVDIGSSAANVNNIGQIPLRIDRAENNVSLDVPLGNFAAGDRIPVTFQVMPNLSGADREFTITATFPESFTLTSDDVLSSKDSVNIEVEANQLTLTGVQLETLTQAPDYIVTTNINDEMCRTPDFGNPNPGGYVELEDLGIEPSFSGFDDDGDVTSRNGIVIPFNTMFGGRYSSFQLYNNTEASGLTNNVMSIHGNGYISLSDTGTLGSLYYHLPNGITWMPNIIAPLWRGFSSYHTLTQFSSKLDSSNGSGITVASTDSGIAIVDYGNAKDYNAVLNADDSVVFEPLDNSIDYQVIFNVNTRFGTGEYELFMAYKNIDWGSRDGEGAIGLKGFTGAMSEHFEITNKIILGVEYAFDGLKSKLSDDLVICYDYVGPESSQFEVIAWVTLNKETVGQDLTIDAISHFEGMEDIAMTHTMNVSNNITLSGFPDQTVDENSELEIQVLYSDENSSANQISASGEHISFSIDNHETGSILTLIPEKDFHGETQVTITVADVDYPTDAASQSFMLTVVSDGIDPVVPPVVAPVEPEDDDDGGSLSLLSLIMIGFFGLRRKRIA
ncbi:MAG: GlyGly-CTERM sorting domain-containing protein, partial [Shewanella sp.]